MNGTYWVNGGRRTARRRLLARSLQTSGGLAAVAFVAACSSSNNNNARPATSAATRAASVTSPAGAGPASPVSGGASPAARPATAAAGAATAAARQPKAGGTAIFRAGPGEPPNQDPYDTSNYYLHILGVGAAYSRLIKSKTGPDVPLLTVSPVPDVAETWEQPDDQTYTFHLRKGVKWQNIAPVGGRELVAQDVAYSYNKQLQSIAIKSFMSTADKITAVDAYTVQIHSKQPNADLLVDLVDGHNKIVAHEAVELKGDLKNGPTIGSGPWVVKEWVPNSVVSFTRNPDYFIKGVPYPNEFHWQRIADVSTWLAAFRTKQIDNYSDTPAVIKKLQGEIAGLTLIRGQGYGLHQILCKCTNPPYNDVRVRQALLKALDRQNIINTLYDGSGWMYAGIIAQAKDWLLPDDEINKLLAYDPKGAQQLLQAAGQANLKDNIEVHNLGTSTTAVFELIQAQLKQAGISLDANLIQNETFIAHLTQGDFKGLTYGIQASPPSATSDLLSRYHSGGSQAGHSLNDPQLDAMIDQQSTIVKDEAGRRKLLLDIQRKLIDLAAVIPIVSQISQTVVWPFVQGWSVPTLTWEYAHMADVWLDQ